MIALLGDLHLGVKGGDIDFLEYQKGYIKSVIEFCSNNDINHVIQAGDFFDVRKTTDNRILDYVTGEFLDLLTIHNIQWHNILGNHDIYYRNCNSITPLNILPKISKNFKTYSTIQDVMIDNVSICLIPWLDEANTIALDKFNSKASIAIGHLALDGYAMYSKSIAKTGMQDSVFAKFKKVFTGHYHTISEKSNILYIGSPYHLTWADFVDGDNRGFFVIENDTGAYEFIPNSTSLFTVFDYDCEKTYTIEDLEQYKGMIATININSKSSEKHYKGFIKLINEVGFIDYRLQDNTEFISPIVEVVAFEADNLLDVFKSTIECENTLALANSLYERL